jgi:GDP-L-fucose synthase
MCSLIKELDFPYVKLTSILYIWFSYVNLATYSMIYNFIEQTLSFSINNIMKKNSKILVLGSRGMVGSAILRTLKQQDYTNLLHPVREELDLMFQADVLSYFEKHQPEFVFVSAAKVGGILANDKYRADFIFENLQIQQNIFNAAFKVRTPNILFLGSSCIYPKNCPQPIKEEYLLTSELEPTNEPYAIAKIAGLKTAESFRRQYGMNWISVMPTNLYGIKDNYHPENSHVIPGLIARLQKAIDEKQTEFKIWGTGKPRREFLYVDDMVRACLHIMHQEEVLPDIMNIGTGEDIEIGELAQLIAKKMDFKGKLVFDTSKPDGTMRKLLDISRIKATGWAPEVNLNDGLDIVIKHYRELGCS